MLAIRMQRVGRKGHPEFRVVVQDARLTPTSGRVVARVGHVNPHTKVVTIDKEKIEYYLGNGAQPSPRVVRVLQAEKIKLPEWVTLPSTDKKHSIKTTEKLRRNRPAEPVEETPAEPETAEVAAEEPKAEEVEVVTDDTTSPEPETTEEKTEA